jgi:hypothetical protein
VNTVANTTVNKSPEITSRRYPPIKAECAQVKEAPEVSNKLVFKRGINHGLITSIPFGGHTQPISGAGLKLAWKKAQKKAKNNITSETMNKIIPKRSPCCT